MTRKPLAPPPPPLHSLLSVGFAGQGTWNTGDAYDYFSADDLFVQGGLSVGVDLLQLSATSTLAVDLEALLGRTETEGPLPQFVETELLQGNVGAGLSLRYALLSWLAPHVRVGGG